MTASSMKVWPGKQYITINRWYGENDDIKNPIIYVTNTESYGLNVSVRVDSPHISTMDEGYSFIPDLSWVKTDPEILYLPPYSTGEIEIFIQVPESEQSLHYNERWETLVVVSPPMETGGGLNVQTELAVKLFIRTPTGEAEQIQYIPIVFIVIFLIIVVLVIFYGKKKKMNKSEKNK